jgi:glycosyltransferase involved in cell wall biosynthesis
MRAVVVVPCYNEASRLRSEIFSGFAEATPDVSFLFVDDGSTDESSTLLAELAKRGPRFEVLTLKQNMGKAEAVRRGLLQAFDTATDLVGYWDADLATPLEELDAMARLLEGDAELVFVLAARVGLLGRDIQRSHYRHYLGRLFATTASLLLGSRIYDTQCGAKLFRNSAAVRSVFAEPFKVNWTFDVEVIARFQALARAGALPTLELVGTEHPVQCWRDVPGSKLTIGAMALSALELARLWRCYRLKS